MYLDLTEHRDRFAAYQLDPSQLGSYSSSKEAEAEGIRQQIEREYGLRQADISSRLGAARIGANASMANAKLAAQTERAKLKLAREEMERIGIPDMEIRRFVAEKNYEIAKLSFGLDVIKTAVAYNSTPDQRFQAADFEQLTRAGLGQGGVLTAPTSRPQGQPTPNSLEDLVARITGGSGGAGSSVSGTPQQLPGGQQQGMIPTAEAAQAVVGANPPSPFVGLSESDQAALKTIQAMYSQGLDFRSWDQMSPTQQANTTSGGKRLAYDTTLEDWRMNQKRPGQGDARAA